ncbi:MAG: sialate O-acetylesterase [Pseudomonadota bacterium]
MKWVVRGGVLIVWGVTLVYVFGFGALMGRFSPNAVEDSMARSFKLVTLVTGGFEPCQGVAPLACGFQDTTGRTPVSCDAYRGERSAVLFTFGQSNSANAGQDRYIPLRDVANFSIHDGKCYRAEDPLLGPDGTGGSVWGVLGDQLISNGLYDRVLIVPFGIGGSALSQWRGDGPFQEILLNALTAIDDAAIEPTHVLWHQGESDALAETSTQDYFSMFEELVDTLRQAGIGAPVYPAVATHCAMTLFGADQEVRAGAQAVRQAQQELVAIEGVLAGPDTDKIQGLLFRHDNCHFNAKGMQAHASAWLEALR